jgi:hypothetical protein
VEVVVMVARCVGGSGSSDGRSNSVVTVVAVMVVAVMVARRVGGSGSSDGRRDAVVMVVVVTRRVNGSRQRVMSGEDGVMVVSRR